MVDRTETLLHTVSRTYPMVYGNNLHFPFTTCHCLVPTIRKDCYDSLCSQSAFLLRLGKVTFSSSADFCGPWDGLQIRIIKLFNDVYFLSWKRGQSTSLSLWVPYRFCFFFFFVILVASISFGTFTHSFTCYSVFVSFCRHVLDSGRQKC